MRIAAYILFGLAGLACLTATDQIIATLQAPAGRSGPYVTGYIVGSVMVPLVLFIIGLSLLKKSD